MVTELVCSKCCRDSLPGARASGKRWSSQLVFRFFPKMLDGVEVIALPLLCAEELQPVEEEKNKQIVEGTLWFKIQYAVTLRLSSPNRLANVCVFCLVSTEWFSSVWYGTVRSGTVPLDLACISTPPYLVEGLYVAATFFFK